MRSRDWRESRLAKDTLADKVGKIFLAGNKLFLGHFFRVLAPGKEVRGGPSSPQGSLTILSDFVSIRLRFPVLAVCWSLEAQPARG